MIAKIPRFWPSPFLLAAHLERGEDQGQWLRELARWVDDEESRARNARSKSALHCRVGAHGSLARPPSVTERPFGAPWPTEFWRGPNLPIRATRPKLYGYWARGLPGSILQPPCK